MQIVPYPSTSTAQKQMRWENWAWRSDRCLCLPSKVIPFNLPFAFNQHNTYIVFT